MDGQHLRLQDVLVVEVQRLVIEGVGRAGGAVSVWIDVRMQAIGADGEGMLVPIMLKRDAPIRHQPIDPGRAGCRHDAGRVQHIAAQAPIEIDLGVNPVGEERVRSGARDTLTEAAIDDGRAGRGGRQVGAIIRKSPDGGGVPGIRDRRRIVEGQTRQDRGVVVCAGDGEFVNVSDVRVVHMDDAVDPVIGGLNERPGIRGDSPRVINRHLVQGRIVVGGEPTRGAARLWRLGMRERRLHRRRDRRRPWLARGSGVAVQFKVTPVRF